MRELVVDSTAFGPLPIRYRELGAGPPLLLVHGLMTTSYSWRYVLHELAQDFRVIAPDLPGCGGSGKPLNACYSMESLAGFLLEFQRALGVRGCAVVGNSMGGLICLRAALRDEEAFSRVIDIHSPGPADWRYHLLSRVLGPAPVRRMLVKWIQRDPRRWAHRNVHYHDETIKSVEEAAEYGDPLGSPEGADAFVRYLWQTFRPADLDAFLAELTRRRDSSMPFPAPLLLLYARTDPLVSPRIGPLLQELIPDARLEWVENSSHFAHVDTPEAVISSVRSFLAEQPGRLATP